MPKIDYSRIDQLEQEKQTRDLYKEEKLELRQLKWNKYQLAYKAKPEIHNRLRKCNVCDTEVPEYQYQNHRHKYHRQNEHCDICGIDVKFLANHQKSKKHQENIKERLFNKIDYINNEVPGTSSTNQTTQAAEQEANSAVGGREKEDTEITQTEK